MLRWPNSPASRSICPACGQLLAPSCRVCVACKHTIDPAELAWPRAVALPAPELRRRTPRPVPRAIPLAHFFCRLIGISFVLALIFQGFWGEQKAQLAMGGAQTLAGVWVFFDALRQRVPRPLRWGVGSMLLPVVIFPWYLARRNKPQSPVPFVEAEVGPVTRFVLICVADIYPGQFDFLHRARSPTRHQPQRPHPRSTTAAAIPNPGLPTFTRGNKAAGEGGPGEGSHPLAGRMERSGGDQRAIRCLADVNLAS